MTGTTTALKELRSRLISGRNPDGGWGYQSGKSSRLEPTCWAAMALAAERFSLPLNSWPARDGLLLERSEGAPNYAFHGMALLVFRALAIEHALGTTSLVTAIQKVKGRPLPPSTVNRQDNSLQGWSWIADTFSWVEPTAWCLLALKHWARTSPELIDASRINVAERLLVDRCCVEGGWNYGNANMLGQQLKPFVPTTAIALLAMQDRRMVAEVERSIDFLERNSTSEKSGPSLSLTLFALRTYGRPVAAARDALVAQVPTTLAFGNHMAIAMTLHSLSSEEQNAPFAL